MRKSLVILFSFLFILVYPQVDPGPHPGYARIKGKPYFLRDSKGRIITTESGGVLTILGGIDTVTSVLVPAPDTIQSFIATKAITDTFSSIKTEIRSYWTLEEAAGDAIDSVGIVNLPVYGAVVREETGKIGNCYSFPGATYLGPASPYFEFTGSFSMSCWISTTHTSVWDCIMSCFSPTNYGWELISVGNPIRVLYWRMRYSWGNKTIYGSTDINDGAWYHIAASYSAVDDTMKLWVNGTLEGSIKNTDGTWYDANSVFLIGDRLNSAASYVGKIDEPALWNRELTHAEVLALYGEDQYPFTEGSGGDSLRLQMVDFDERADTVRIIANLLGEGRSNSRTDGTLLLAFNMADSADYNDTTVAWPYDKDTTWIIEAYTGLIPEDIWTYPPNYDTTFFDSSDVTPPDQDVGVWDTIYYNDFEDLSAPSHYDRTTFLSEWSPVLRYASHNEYRASDFRSPLWYNENLKDSIVIDETTGSKVMQVLWKDTIIDDYDCQSGRGGDYWLHTIDGEPYTEIYVSSNIMLRPGFDVSAGGKLCWGISGGSNTGSGVTAPEYGDGFRNIVTWGYEQSLDYDNTIAFYNYYQDMPGEYGQIMPWGQFQPEGAGLTGRYNASGYWTFPTDSTWFNITVRCVTNTHSGSTPIKNGIFEGYINGHLIVQWSGLYLITYPDIGNEINLLNWYQSFGGGGPPLRDEWIWNDDICIFTYDVSVDVPRGNELSQPGRILSLPNWPKPIPKE